MCPIMYLLLLAKQSLHLKTPIPFSSTCASAVTCERKGNDCGSLQDWKIKTRTLEYRSVVAIACHSHLAMTRHRDRICVVWLPHVIDPFPTSFRQLQSGSLWGCRSVGHIGCCSYLLTRNNNNPPRSEVGVKDPSFEQAPLRKPPISSSPLVSIQSATPTAVVNPA